MQITTPYGTLVVNSETKIPLTITNALFVDDGSHALPFTVPYCEHNLKALNYPNRLGGTLRGGTPMQTRIKMLDIDEVGELSVVSCVKPEIELSFLTREGMFWRWAKETNLRDLPTTEIRTVNWTAEKNNIISGVWPQIEFAVFPVVTVEDLQAFEDSKFTANGFPSSWLADGGEYDFKRSLCEYILLNKPEYFLDGLPANNNIGIFDQFIFVNQIIYWICERTGVLIKENLFESDAELNRLCVLNENMNKNKFSGSFRYSDALPSASVLDFIRTLEATFFCRFTFDLKKKELSIVSNKTKINSTAKNINVAIKNRLESVSKSLSLKASYINSKYTTTSDFDFSLFSQSVETTQDVIKANWIQLESTEINTAYANKLVFSYPMQCMFYVHWVQGDKWQYTWELIDSRFKDYNSSTAADSVDVESDGTFAPTIPITILNPYGIDPPEYGGDIIMVRYAERNINVPEIGSGFNTIKKIDVLSYNTNEKTPIVLAFKRTPTAYSMYNNLNQQVNFTIPYGDTVPMGSTGNIGLTWQSLYFQFYTEYADMLKYAGQIIEIEPTKEVLGAINSINDKYSNKQTSFFFTKIEVELSINGIEITKVEALSTKYLE